MLVTKPSIAGFGMNFQNAHKQAFVGLSYRGKNGIRRFADAIGLVRTPADVHVVMSTVERECTKP